MRKLANKPTYSVKFRRRREKKTNYRKRRIMLLSGRVRFVVRRTNKRIICHIVESKAGQDRTLCWADSRELKKYGWNHAVSNIPAAYLTGYLCAKKSKKKKAILDMGLFRSTKGSRIYACVKGAIDGGMDIPVNEDILPKEDRIKGKHIKEDMEKLFEKVKSKIGGAK